MDKFIEIKSLEAFELAKKDKSIFLFTASWCPDCSKQKEIGRAHV